MTTLVKTSNKINLNSKKGRQLALESKINEIDNRLKELGVEGLKYKLTSGISNPETTQNQIRIDTCMDINWLFRALAYYKNIQQVKKDFCKDANLTDTLPLLNNQSLPISDIVHDIQLRIVYLSHQKEINTLTQMKQKLMPFMDEESRFISTLKEIDFLLKQE